MKRIFLLLLTFTPLYAFGDFVPGRVRADAAGNLHRVSGDGRFQNVQEVRALEMVTDGKGITSYQVALDKAPAFPFLVRSREQNRCGTTFFASFTQNGRDTQLRLDESSADACLRNGKITWRATLTTDEGAGKKSQLVVDGVPEYFMITQ